MLTPAQARAARALLKWTQAETAAAAGLHVNVITAFERGSIDPRASSLEALQGAFERAGVEFIPGGARLRP